MLKKKANAAKANDSQVGGEPLEPPSTNPFSKSPATHKLVFSIIHQNFKLQIYVQNMDPFFDTSSPHLLNSPCFFSFSPPILLFLSPKKAPNRKFQPSLEKKTVLHLQCIWIAFFLLQILSLVHESFLFFGESFFVHIFPVIFLLFFMMICPSDFRMPLLYIYLVYIFAWSLGLSH